MLNFRRNRKESQVEAGLAAAEAGVREPEAKAPPEIEVKRKVLVVAKDYSFTTGVVDYAVNLAERLGYDLVAVNLEPRLEPGGFFSPYQQHLRTKFTQTAKAAWQMVLPELTSRGIRCEHVIKFAGVARAVNDLNHEIKRIDFVIADQGIREEEIAEEIPLPVFTLTGYQGEKVMGKEDRKAKPWGKTIVFGALAAALYGVLFSQASTVMSYFTRGGWYAALPLTTVFVFSFVHGAFANYLWSALGIEAIKRAQPRTAARKPAQRKRPRPQLRLNA